MLKLQKEDFPKFIDSLRKKHEVLAPVRQDILRYKILDEEDEVIFEAPPYPAKRFFLPAVEELFSFKKDEIKAEPEIKKRIVFLPRCDANSLLKIDKLYLDEYKDENYRKRRENTILIEFFCHQIYPNCFCSSMDLEDCFDLKLFEGEDGFYVKVGSKKGKALLRNFKSKFKKTKDKEFKYNCPRKLNRQKATKLRNFLESKVWAKESQKCLSCSACTSVCPNCCCFDVYDKVKIENLEEGKRKRRWDSCQLLTFTEVAGGHVFRKERNLRLKHRIYHKFIYFMEEYGQFMCTGCGRCITVCPTKIDLLKIMEKLK